MASFTFSEFEDDWILFPSRIETDRLVFEALPVADVSVKNLYRIQGEERFEDIVSDMPGSVDWSMKETAEYFESAYESFSENEGGGYVIYKQGNEGTIIGRCGIGVDWSTKEAQFYIWLLPEHRGHGYSTERGEAFLELAFDVLELSTVRCGAVVDNTASRSAIEKYIVDNGGQEEGTFRQYKKIDESLKDIVYYSITSEEWES